METKQTTRQMHIGLGEAIQRLMKLEHRMTNGYSSQHDAEERKLLLDALNLTMLDLGFDCGNTNEADIPTTVGIFAKSAATSCCRILPADQSRRAAAPALTPAAAPKLTVASTTPKRRG